MKMKFVCFFHLHKNTKVLTLVTSVVGMALCIREPLGSPHVCFQDAWLNVFFFRCITAKKYTPIMSKNGTESAKE